MTDPSLIPAFQDAAPIVHHVKQHIHHAAPVIKAAHHGVSMLTTFIIATVSSAISGGISWYVARRGIQGVKNDVANAKAEVEKLKAVVSPAPAAPVA